MPRKCGKMVERHLLDPYNMDIFKKKEAEDEWGGPWSGLRINIWSH